MQTQVAIDAAGRPGGVLARLLEQRRVDLLTEAAVTDHLQQARRLASTLQPRAPVIRGRGQVSGHRC